MRAALLLVGPVEPRAHPRRRIALDDERAHGRGVAVVVGVEGAELVGDERLRQRVEGLGRAVPGELAPGMLQRETEFALERPPHQRVDAVGGDDQVLLPQLIQRRQLRAEPQIDAGLAGALLQEPQQLQPADRREADPVDHHPLAHDARWRCRATPACAARSPRPSRDRRRAGTRAPGRRRRRRSPRWRRRRSARRGAPRRRGGAASTAPRSRARPVRRPRLPRAWRPREMERRGLYPLVLAITSAPKRSMRATASAPVAPPSRRATWPHAEPPRALRHRPPCRPRCP